MNNKGQLEGLNTIMGIFAFLFVLIGGMLLLPIFYTGEALDLDSAESQENIEEMNENLDEFSAGLNDQFDWNILALVFALLTVILLPVAFFLALSNKVTPKIPIEKLFQR